MSIIKAIDAGWQWSYGPAVADLAEDLCTKASYQTLWQTCGVGFFTIYGLEFT